MNKPVPSTAEVLAFKVLERNTDQSYKIWVNWAIEMMRAGFEAEYLVILAGESEPFNSFEMHRLIENVLCELDLDYSGKEEILKNYVCFLIDQVMQNKLSSLHALRNLNKLYLELNGAGWLQDFYLLYYAKEDLNYDRVQHYWAGATQENIDQIVTDYFLGWKKTHCSG